MRRPRRPHIRKTIEPAPKHKGQQPPRANPVQHLAQLAADASQESTLRLLLDETEERMILQVWSKGEIVRELRANAKQADAIIGMMQRLRKRMK